MNCSYLGQPVINALMILSIAGLVTACGDDNAGQGKKRARTHLVEISVVAKRDMDISADRTGSLRALREVKLFNQEEGRVNAVYVREGDWVKRGRVLIRLDDRLLRAEHQKSLATLRQAKLDVDRLQRLIQKKLVSEDALSRAVTSMEIAAADEKLLRTRLSYLTIRAPFSAHIAKRNVEPGDVAPKYTNLLTLVDQSTLIIDVQVSELILQRLKIGGRADVRIDALGLQTYPGKIIRIHPTIDPLTRRGRIEVVLKPVPKGARAGQFSRVTLHTSNSSSITIPFSALRRDGKGEFVYVIDDDNKARRNNVSSGLRMADKVEITDGLAVGQIVISKGFLGLSDGKTVTPVNLEKPVTTAKPVRSKDG